MIDAHVSATSAPRAYLEEGPLIERVLDAIGLPAAIVGAVEASSHAAELEADLEAQASAAWRSAIATLAENPRVSCKLSGLGMATHSLAPEVLRPWIEGVLEVFGTARTVFGSNFPVDAMYGTFPELMTAVESALSGTGAAGSAAVLSGNARRIYRLGEHGR